MTIHWRTATATALMAMVLALPSPAPADCATGKRLYRAAVNETDLARRIALLRDSLDACDDFNACYELGKAYEADGRLAKAIVAYRDARILAGSDQARAKTLVRLGLVYEQMDRPFEAYACFRESTGYHAFPGVTAHLKAMDRRRMAEGLSSAEIKRALTASRSNFDVRPSLDLYIHFEYDSHRLGAEGRRQADALGRALTDPALAGKAVTLVGHTDAAGSQTYNLPLSERRAAAVKSYLVSRFPLSPEKIRIMGRGEAEPRYTAPADQGLNRRVEVRIQ